MFTGTQCDLWSRPVGTGHEKSKSREIPSTYFYTLIPSLHEHEASGGGHGRCLYCRLTSFSRSLQINLRINLDGTAVWRFPLPAPVGVAFGSEKSNTIKTELMKSKSPRNQTISRTFGTPWGIRTPGLLVRRLSHAQIGVVSAPICAFYHCSLGESSIVSIQPCLLFSGSGSKLGQAQSSRIPLTSKVELIYIERGSPGRKLFGLFSYIPKLR